MIRDAEIEDIPELMVLLKKFHAESNAKPSGLNYDKKSVVSHLFEMIFSPTSLILVAEIEGVLVGLIGAVSVPWMGDKTQFQVVETYYYIDKNHRGKPTSLKLIKEMEKRAKDSGAKNIVLMSMKNDRQEKTNNFYSRLGFNELETSFYKEL